MIRRLLFAVIIVIGVLACGSTTPSGGTTTSLEDMTGDWQLDHGTVNGVAIPIVKDHEITMTVHVPSITGTSACNHWGGRLALVDGEIHVTEVASTAMGCADDVMASEEAFMRAIGLIRAAEHEGDQLTLVGLGVELVFTRLAPPPAAEIVGTTWRLQSLGQGDAQMSPVGDPAMLVIDTGGTFSGSTGCREFTGSWIEGAGEFVVTSMSMFGECAADRAEQDGLVVGVLGDGFRAQVDGDRLTLTARGSSLQYVAETGPAG